VSDVTSKPRPLEEVYRSSRIPLTRLAFLLVGDRDDADDIVQSVFATAASRWTAIDDPPTYLRRAVANRAHDVHRRSFRAIEPVASGSDADEPDLDGVWSFVKSLPTAQRAVIVLRFYEDLSLVDIAGVLGRPENTVRSDLRRALSHLKRILP
jgi:RNA polymerase sigma factor (sigma-70 family)